MRSIPAARAIGARWAPWGLWIWLAWAWASPLAAATPLRIAVAPFAGETADSPMAQALTGRLATRPLARLIAPDAFVAEPDFDAEAALVRQWAYNAAVDTVVVGRVEVVEDAEAGPSWRIETALRSGHSGAELARQSAALASVSEVDETAERLAAAILETLGFRAAPVPPTEAIRDPRSPEPPLPVASDPPAESTGGGGARFGDLDEDTPIEIEADEAEIVDRGADRKLVFQRNVRVRQGEITLACDRLEAEYPKGDSEPARLVARGSVEVGQGGRRARCDRAVYDRRTQQLSCQGRAELVQGCDVVRGESIEFDLAGEQARVSGAASIVIRPGEAEGASCSQLRKSL